MAKVLFTNVSVLDCSGDDPFAGEVLVEGNKIRKVSHRVNSLPREGTRVVDGTPVPSDDRHRGVPHRCH